MTASERCRLPSRVTSMPFTSPIGRFGTLTLRMVARPMDVERRRLQPLDDDARVVRAGFEVALGVAAQAIGVQRDRHGGLAEEAPFGRGRDRARIQHVVAEIGAVVDARDHHVGLERKQTRDRQVHAVGRRALHEVDIGFGLADAQRHFERERVARAAAIAVRRDHRQVAEALERVAQRDDAARAVTIVVGYEDSHRRAIYSMRSGGGSLSGKRTDPEAELFRDAMRDVKPIGARARVHRGAAQAAGARAFHRGRSRAGAGRKLAGI